MRSLNIDSKRAIARLRFNKKWLEKHCGEYTCHELAKRFRCTYDQVYRFLFNNGLSAKKLKNTTNKKKKVEESEFLTTEMMRSFYPNDKAK